MGVDYSLAFAFEHQASRRRWGESSIRSACTTYICLDVERVEGVGVEFDAFLDMNDTRKASIWSCISYQLIRLLGSRPRFRYQFETVCLAELDVSLGFSERLSWDSMGALCDMTNGLVLSQLDTPYGVLGIGNLSPSGRLNGSEW